MAEKVTIKHGDLGSLRQISDLLWRLSSEEIARNGHSDLTLDLEAASRGIREIIEINNIAEIEGGR